MQFLVKILTTSHVSSLCSKSRLISQTLSASKRKPRKNPQKALKEETLARAGTVPALGALQSQVLEIKAENFSLEELSQELRRKALSATHQNTGKKPNHLLATVLGDVPGISLRVDDNVASLLARELSKLCADRCTSPRNWHNQSK